MDDLEKLFTDLRKGRAEVAETNPEFADLIGDADDTVMQGYAIDEGPFNIPEFKGNESIEKAFERAKLMEDFCGYSSEEAQKIAFQQIQTQPAHRELTTRAPALSKRSRELMPSLIKIIREEARHLKGFEELGDAVGAHISARGFATYLEAQL